MCESPVREEAADRALVQEIMCDPAKHPLAQSAMAIGSSDQKVDILLADDAEQFVRHVRCLQHERRRRRDAMTGQIIHDIAHAVLDGFGFMLRANLHEEDLFGIMQERQ